MHIHLQELNKGKTSSFRETLDVSDLLKGRKDVLSAGPLRVSLDARGEDGTAVVEGELTIDVASPCARCLEPVRGRLEIPFLEHFKVSHEPQTEEEEEQFVAVQEDTVDLKPYVEEALLLGLPFAPLCREDCKGLCAECGADLNEGECGCSREKIDPRLSALKDFFKP